MITDADRARICEAMGGLWAQDECSMRFYRTEAEFAFAVQKHFRIACDPTATGEWISLAKGSAVCGADEPEQAILLAALAVLDAKEGE